VEEGDPQKAEAAYRRAIDYDLPHTSARAAVNLGRASLRRGQDRSLEGSPDPGGGL
jgi:hypothetical protein